MKAIFTISILHFSLSVLAAPTDDFVTTWKTDNPGYSNDTSIRVPMKGGPYDVDWNNDGVFDEFGIYGTATHDYMVAGTYTIRIRGSYDSILMGLHNGRYIEPFADVLKITSLDQWGTNQWKSLFLAFWGAGKLRIPATDTPDLSAVKSLWGIFERATNVNPDVSDWDTSAVTSMSAMFYGAKAANPDVGGWDTSAVTSMAEMFRGISTNPDVSNLDTSAVRSMGGMFFGAHAANPDVGDWDTSAVTNLSSMFSRTTVANPDVSAWDTSAVRGMAFMFHRAFAANPDVSNWDTSAVIDTSYMFRAATSFNQNLGAWDVTSLKYAMSMFTGVTLSPVNYDSLLVGWSAQNLNRDVVFDGGNSTYCSAEAAAARERMIADYSWKITDGGQSCRPNKVRATDGTFRDLVRVTFNLVPGATVYRVFRCLDMGPTCGSPIGYPKTGSFDDKKVILGTVYYYRVKACTSSTCTKFSVANTGFATTQPARPTGINATDGTYSDRVNISWNAVEDASVYRVFRCLDTGLTCGSPIGFPHGTSFDDKKGETGVVYYYRVKACTTQQCSKFSVASAGSSW